MLVILLFIALSKSVYIIIGLLFFFIPITRFPNRRFYMISLTLTAFAGIAGFLTGSYYTSRVYSLVDPGVPFFHNLSETFNQVDHQRQLGFILANPVEYISILALTLKDQWMNLVYSGIGVLGWLNVILPFWYYVFMIFAILTIAISENPEKIFLNLKMKALILSVITLTAILIFTISYLTWTPVGKTTIDGLQGRYFIPFLPLIFLMFHNRFVKIPEKIVGTITFITFLVSFFVSIFAIHHRYWDFI